MKVETPQLSDKLKDVKINKILIHEVVNTILSNSRAGNACTKIRAEVSGGGRKPWRQKGTGRARAGSNRSPIWRGGGVVFGPTREQSFKKRIPKKKKQKATIGMIAQRIAEDGLKVVDELSLSEPKTKLAAAFLKDIFGGNENKTLVLMEERKPEVFRAFRNIRNVTITDWRNINTYLLLEHEKILFTQAAWDSFLGSKGLEESGKYPAALGHKLKVEGGK